MEKKTKTTTTRTAYGKELDTPIPYTFEWPVYKTPEEMVAANDGMSLVEQMKQRNRDAMASARSASLTAALLAAGFEKPTAANNDLVRLRELYKNLLTARLPNGEPKYTEASARTFAAEASGVEWPDEDE